MEVNTYQIFPQPVMRFNLGREFSENEKQFFESIKNKKEKFNFSDSISKDKFILNQIELKDIKEFCELSLNIFLHKIYSPDDDAKIQSYITQSWINYMETGTNHSPHTHSNSFLSGCFYIDVDKNVDTIDFVQYEYRPIAFSIKNINDFNTTITSFKVNPYDLIIFPSSLYHAVPKTKNKNTRISLAFNSFLKGEFGNPTKQLNYLNI